MPLIKFLVWEGREGESNILWHLSFQVQKWRHVGTVLSEMLMWLFPMECWKFWKCQTAESLAIASYFKRAANIISSSQLHVLCLDAWRNARAHFKEQVRYCVTMFRHQCCIEALNWENNLQRGILQVIASACWSFCLLHYSRSCSNCTSYMWHSGANGHLVANTFQQQLAWPGGDQLQLATCWIRFGCEQTWLILPAVICLSQRLSHACLSISFNMARLWMAH